MGKRKKESYGQYKFMKNEKHIIINSKYYDNMHIHKVLDEYEKYVRVEKEPVCHGDIEANNGSFDEPGKALNRDNIRSIAKSIQNECERGERDKGVCANCIRHFYT